MILKLHTERLSTLAPARGVRMRSSELHPEPQFHAVAADARMDSRHMAVAVAEVGIEIGVGVEVDVGVEEPVLP